MNKIQGFRFLCYGISIGACSSAIIKCFQEENYSLIGFPAICIIMTTLVTILEFLSTKK